MPQPQTLDTIRQRIATLTAQQQTAVAEAERSEGALRELGWDPATETAEVFCARLKQEEAALAAKAETALTELDTMVSQYEGGGEG